MCMVAGVAAGMGRSEALSAALREQDAQAGIERNEALSAALGADFETQRASEEAPLSLGSQTSSSWSLMGSSSSATTSEVVGKPSEDVHQTSRPDGGPVGSG